MSGFWDKKGIVPQEVAYQQASVAQESNTVELDEEAFAEIQQEEYSVFEEEDDDLSSVLTSANLRLECGRLFEMIIKSDLFGQTDADPDAIRTVERLMRNFAKTQLEIMLGMRQEETPTQSVVVSSPFNDMEVTVLKMLASKMSKGATEQEQTEAPQVAPQPPKKDGISQISGSVRPKPSTPLKREVKPIQRKAAPTPQPSQPKAKPKPPAPAEEGSALTKPIDQMTPAELAAHDKAASQRSLSKYAKMPTNLVPMPSSDQLVQMYTIQAGNMSPAGSTIAQIMAKSNQNQ